MFLKSIGIEEFKKVIYPEYKKIFPESEQKPYQLIKKSFKANMTEIIQIIEDDTFIGFLIINTIENTTYTILDYFAILPQYQDKGYGSKAITLLKEQRKNEGIIVEVEKCGLGKNQEENEIRKKRVKLYERLGFCKMGFDLDLYKTIYSIYLLPSEKNKIINENGVIQDMFNIYIAISGENRVRRNCKVMSEGGKND